jgi:hypothetical protein
VVYPVVQPDNPVPESVCTTPAPWPIADYSWVETNPNGCWDWWGYLDNATYQNRYVTKAAPQMQVIDHIIGAVTAPITP